MNSMTMSELYEKLTQGLPADELVLDVRDEDEYAEGHVPGSRNIPHEQVLSFVEELRPYKRVYIHCGGGGRAGKATEALRQAGLTELVHIRESGMRHWIAAGWPTEK